MTAKNFLAPADFNHVVRFAPLVAIDLVLRDPEGAVLLGKRCNEPAKDTWFVPGGILRKGEKIAAAFGRILAGETGLTLPFSAARLLGAYEHFYDTNHNSVPGFGTHYIVLGHEVKFDKRPDIVPDDQHAEMKWMRLPELLAAPDVHENTKAYFR